VSLLSHTDATPYPNGDKGYSNWELSSDRANASRLELIAGGIDEGKIVRVVGLGPAVMLDKDNPFNSVNRRISIVVLNKKAEEFLAKEGGPAVEGKDEPPSALDGVGPADNGSWVPGAGH
jgi:chemotaxis protein MotB